MDTNAQSAKAPDDRNHPDGTEAPRGAEEWMDDPAILEAWMSSLISVRGRSQATAKRYRRLVERLLEDVGKPIAQLDQRLIERHVRRLHVAGRGESVRRGVVVAIPEPELLCPWKTPCLARPEPVKWTRSGVVRSGQEPAQFGGIGGRVDERLPWLHDQTGACAGGREGYRKRCHPRHLFPRKRCPGCHLFREKGCPACHLFQPKRWPRRRAAGAGVRARVSNFWP